MDHGGEGGGLDNEAAFAALHDVLLAGRAVGIFPEGLSHLDSQLAPLKTGAARIALGVARKAPDRPVYVVPTGLSYFTRHRFRSSVLIQFGAPIEVGARDRAEAEADERAAVRSLTGRIEIRLRALTVNAGSWETLRVLDAVRRLYQPDDLSLEERVELARRFNAVYPQVAHHPEVRALYGRVRTYQERLAAAGLSDSILKRELGVRETVARVIGHVALILFWGPLCLLGAPIHAPLGLALKLLGRRVAPRKDVVATAKFVLGLLAVLAVYATLATLAWWRIGAGAAAAVAVFLPLSGWAFVHVAARLDALRHLAATLVRVVWLRREVAALRRERAELVLAVNQAVDRYKPDDMEPMFAGPR
jgi:glycerol-3-phosphate O-acyltransferase/dihydroxyacetone phosphate acyltransferase